MQHQIAVIAHVRAVATIVPLADIPSQYEAPAREIVVVSYEEGTDYNQIAQLLHAASDQVSTTVRNSAGRYIAQVVHDAVLPVGGVAVDADPMGLYEVGHILGMVAQLGEIQVSYLPIHAAPIYQEEAVAELSIADDTAVTFVPQDTEAAA